MPGATGEVLAAFPDKGVYHERRTHARQVQPTRSGEVPIKERYGKATELPSHELLPRAASARKCMALSCVLYFPDGYGSA
jgi:hypothetical protein